MINWSVILNWLKSSSNDICKLFLGFLSLIDTRSNMWISPMNEAVVLNMFFCLNEGTYVAGARGTYRRTRRAIWLAMSIR